jgi:hypothetical protein
MRLGWPIGRGRRRSSRRARPPGRSFPGGVVSCTAVRSRGRDAEACTTAERAQHGRTAVRAHTSWKTNSRTGRAGSTERTAASKSTTAARSSTCGRRAQLLAHAWAQDTNGVAAGATVLCAQEWICIPRPSAPPGLLVAIRAFLMVLK